jgi:hypothetical protein
MGDLIQLSLKGMAEYLTSNSAKQRRILLEHKFREDEEGKAKRQYYQEASRIIRQYHSSSRASSWLESQASALMAKAMNESGSKRTRLRSNATAIKAYEENFGDRSLTLVPAPRHKYRSGMVAVSFTPDLGVMGKQGIQLVKLDFCAGPMNPEAVNIMRQLMYCAVSQSGAALPLGSLILTDVRAGEEHKAKRILKRTQDDIDAAIRNIEAIWPTLTR